jgi:hypothetical protein
MLPPGFVASDDALKTPNHGQAYLWDCWQYLAEQVADYPIVAVVGNGDCIDGCQPAQRGTEFCLPMLEDQTAAAEVTLGYLQTHIKSAPQWFFTQGTEYHDSKTGREAEVLAKAMGARRYSGLGTGRYCRQVLDLEVDGVVINVAHGISVSGGLYRTTAPDREAVWSALAGKDGKMPKADILVRSHAHYFAHVEHASKHAVITPCWQLQTRHMRKNSVYRMLPDIGAVVVWIDVDARARREDPISVQKILFDLPKIGTTKL